MKSVISSSQHRPMAFQGVGEDLLVLGEGERCSCPSLVATVMYSDCVCACAVLLNTLPRSRSVLGGV